MSKEIPSIMKKKKKKIGSTSDKSRDRYLKKKIGYTTLGLSNHGKVSQKCLAL